MHNYPEKTCTIDRLISLPKLVKATLHGDKTQQRRDGIYAYPGETFKLENVEFIISSLERQKLGNMTDKDANAEGYLSLSLYKASILKMHQGMTWDDNSLVWVHSFNINTIT